jgi:hypothetical protein
LLCRSRIEAFHCRFFLGIGFPDAAARRPGIGLRYHGQKTYPAERNVLACCGAFWR